MIGNTPPPHHWTPDMCGKCPVPEILRANACQNMQLKALARRSLLGLIKKVEVTAYCNKVNQVVSEPHIGCGQCHPLPPEFIGKSK